MVSVLADNRVKPVLNTEIMVHDTDGVTHKSYYAGATLAWKRRPSKS